MDDYADNGMIGYVRDRSEAAQGRDGGVSREARRSYGALTRFGVEETEIHTDFGWDAKVNYPSLKTAMDRCERSGKVLVMPDATHLGGSIRSIRATVKAIQDRGIPLILVHEKADTREDGGLFFRLADSLSRVGYAETMGATQEGRKRSPSKSGNPSAMTPKLAALAKKKLADKAPARQIAADIGVSLSTFYKWMRREGISPS